MKTSPVNHLSGPYLPIDCNYYDRLEAAIVLKKETGIIYFDADGTLRQSRTRLINLHITDGAEFLELASGIRIRLDRLHSLDGEVLPGSSSASAASEGEKAP